MSNIACRIFAEQVKMLLSLPNQDEAKTVLYQAVINSLNQFENHFDNQNENAYVSVSVSVSESLSVLSKSILDLLSKNITWKKFSNNYGGKRAGAGKRNNNKERGKTSITPLRDENNTSNTDVIVAEGERVEEGIGEREKEGKYAFEGKVIKLTHKDYESWQKAYPELNLYAECLVRDEWLSHQDNTKNWFISTAKYFVNQNEERKKQHEEKENDWAF